MQIAGLVLLFQHPKVEEQAHQGGVELDVKGLRAGTALTFLVPEGGGGLGAVLSSEVIGPPDA